VDEEWQEPDQWGSPVTAIADALEAPEYVDIEVVLLCSGEEPLERRRDSTGWLGKGTPCVAPFRKAKIPFGNAIPLGLVFLVTQKSGHLAALNGMPTKVPLGVLLVSFHLA
jgi:hypothetical protein